MMKHEKFLRISVIGLALLTVVLMVSGLSGAARGDLPSGVANGGSLSVGYVSMDDLQKGVPDFVELQKYNQRMSEELAAYIQLLQVQAKNSVQAIEEERAQKKQGKSADEQKKIDATYDDQRQQKLQEYQKQIDQKRTELSAKVNEQNKQTFDKVKKLIENVAKSQNISVVMDDRVLFYGGVDLTKKVIEAAGKSKK
jgi:Skp family chaperone for outer membrane proteins